MVELNCTQCGAQFTTHDYRRESAHFCSRSCWNQWRHEHAYQRTCPLCGREFWNNREQRNRRYCSEECTQQARRKYDHSDRLCAQCGSPFPYSSRAPHRRYCSPKCRALRSAFPINEHFFATIDSEGQAYALGLIYSDGCIYTTQNNHYINFSSKDEEQVQLFTRLLESERTIYESSSGSYAVTICNRHLYDDLVRLGVTERKSWKEYPLPPIPDAYLHHFVRGFFDGDGSVVLSKIQGGRYTYLVMSFHGGSHTFLSDLRDLLIRQGIKPQPVHADRNNWRLSISQQASVARLADWMYYGATYRLQRKYDVVTGFYDGQLPSVSRAMSAAD